MLYKKHINIHSSSLNMKESDANKTLYHFAALKKKSLFFSPNSTPAWMFAVM